MSFGTPRGKLKVNTGHPGGFGFLGSGTLTVGADSILLTATQRVPASMTLMFGLLCIPLLGTILWYCYHGGLMGAVFTLPLSGLLLAKTGSILLCGACVTNVILAGDRVQFTSTPRGGGASRTVYLHAENAADAESIRVLLTSMSSKVPSSTSA